MIAARRNEVFQNYTVNFNLTFLKADNPTPSPLTRTMAIWEPIKKDELKTYFENEIQRSIAGINEFPLEDVAVEVVSFFALPLSLKKRFIRWWRKLFGAKR